MDQQLVEKLIAVARAAREKAYAPYSRYSVGAALETKCGQVFSGCNIENAAYPSSMCAERVALFQAVAAGFTHFQALAVVTGGSQLATPCGGCRQVMAEFSLDLPVIIANTEGEYRITTVEELIPGAFTGDNLDPGRCKIHGQHRG